MVEQLESTMEVLARSLAAFHSELKDQGMDEDFAQVLTLEVCQQWVGHLLTGGRQQPAEGEG